MADTSTGLPVKSLAGEFVLSKLVDTGGTNVGAVSATGALSGNIVAYGGTATTLGQKVMASSIPVALASDSSLAVTLGANQSVNVAQVGGTNTVSGGVAGTLGVGGVLAHDAAAAAALPVGVGFFASAAAPTDVSADGDSVKAWALRNGAQVTNLASGGTLITVAQKNMAGSFPVVIASDQSNLPGNIVQVGGVNIGATAFLPTRLTDGTAYYAKTGQTAGTAAFAQLSDQTTAVGVIVATTALKVDLSSVAGTATVTGGVAGTQAMGGVLAHDAAAAAALPVGIGAFASAAAPADVSADGDAVKLWALRNGSPVVNIAAGGTLLTNIGQAAATATFVRINDGTTTAGVIVGTTALKTDFSSIIGSVPGAANPIPVRLTDGAAFYSAGSSAPTAPTYSTQTSAALGAGASATLTHYVTSGKTGRLYGADVSSTVPLKIAISTIVTGTPTTRVVLFSIPGQQVQWRSPYPTFITRASADATTGFGVVITNKDAATAADVYSTAYWDEV